jgi:hypothetical protein
LVCRLELPAGGVGFAQSVLGRGSEHHRGNRHRGPLEIRSVLLDDPQQVRPPRHRPRRATRAEFTRTDGLHSGVAGHDTLSHGLVVGDVGCDP